MFELIKRGYLMIERRPETYDVIIKFRFDLGLKAPLVFNESWIERGIVVLPKQIADGGAEIASAAPRRLSRLLQPHQPSERRDVFAVSP